MEKNKFNVLLETSEYDEFRLHKLNRRVEEDKVGFKNLLSSMEKRGFLSSHPLDCIKRGNSIVVRGGHHRLRAASKLNIPVKYVISDSDIDIFELESCGPGKWTIKDYLTSFAKKNYSHYVMLKEYCDETGIAPSNAIAIFNGNYGGSIGSGNQCKQNFCKGTWEIKDSIFPDKIKKIVMQIKSYGNEWASHRSFITALSKVVHLDAFDIDHFRYKIKLKTDFLEKKRDADQYLDMIEQIYNHGTPKTKKIPIKYLVNTELNG